jgi:predicted DNA-binding transcriptional regulator AlpA
MANIQPQITGRKVTVRYLCQRFGIVDRTIDRWVATGILPQPIYINNRRYFDLQEVDERMANRNEGPPRVVRPQESARASLRELLTSQQPSEHEAAHRAANAAMKARSAA